MREIAVFETKEAWSRDAALRFVALAALFERCGGPFRVALTGGSSPDLLHGLLAGPLNAAVNWGNVQVFFGDERCVPPDHEDSNHRLAHETLLAHVPIPPENIFRMEGEAHDHAAAARRYEEKMRSAFGQPIGVPAFDLILLGMGPDGHCASLFPGKPALHETERLCVATEPGLKPFVPRLTLTLPVLNAATNVLFLVSGEGKAETVARVLEGPHAPDELPSQSVVGASGRVTWLLDRPAASVLRFGVE